MPNNQPTRARGKQRSLVKWRADRGYWELSAPRIDGRRLRPSCGTDPRNRAAAEAEAARLYAEALAAAEAQRGKTPGAAQADRATLTQAMGEYWRLRGAHVASSSEIERHSRVLLAELGAETLLTQLSTRTLEDYAARRRVRQGKRDGKSVMLDRANGSINRETGHLRTVLIAAAEWGWSVPRINWKRVRLREPDRKQTILSIDQETALRASLREDYWPLITFALLSGARLENCIGLRWDQIDWQARTITLRVKSQKPGGKLVVLPLTAGLTALLRGQQGDHPDLVFTYVCRRNRRDPHAGVMQMKGERYPFTQHGWRKDWNRARAEIGLPQLRFHDLRHTAAVRTLAVPGGNLVTVQAMLGHSTIATTARYATSDVDKLRAAMEAAQNMATSLATSGGQRRKI